MLEEDPFYLGEEELFSEEKQDVAILGEFVIRRHGNE